MNEQALLRRTLATEMAEPAKKCASKQGTATQQHGAIGDGVSAGFIQRHSHAAGDNQRQATEGSYCG